MLKGSERGDMVEDMVEEGYGGANDGWCKEEIWWKIW